jgi:hypothetical protein
MAEISTQLFLSLKEEFLRTLAIFEGVLPPV